MCCTQVLIRRACELSVAYRTLQATVILLSLVKWVSLARDIPQVSLFIQAFMDASLVLLELALVFLVVGLAIGSTLLFLIGGMAAEWSSVHKMVSRLGEEALTGAALDVLMMKKIINYSISNMIV
jgi:hypothetical protein